LENCVGLGALKREELHKMGSVMTQIFSVTSTTSTGVRRIRLLDSGFGAPNSMRVHLCHRSKIAYTLLQDLGIAFYSSTLVVKLSNKLIINI
jgi:hypothetical protein